VSFIFETSTNPTYILCLGFLLCERVQQPCLDDDDLGEAPIWGGSKHTQSFRDVIHELGGLIVL
jgi:hypothetical protein